MFQSTIFFLLQSRIIIHNFRAQILNCFQNINILKKISNFHFRNSVLSCAKEIS